MSGSVGSEFPKEQARARALLEQYIAIGPAGAFAAQLIRDVLTRAEQAQASGDIIAILRSFAELRSLK